MNVDINIKYNFNPLPSTGYYLHPCARSDPDVNECLTESANNMVHYFKQGIPDLGITNVEPIVIDEIHLALGSGPDGYRATFRDINAYGVSNMTVIGARWVRVLGLVKYYWAFYLLFFSGVAAGPQYYCIRTAFG